MSVASELLRLLEESRESERKNSADKILLSASSKKLLEEALTEISQRKKIAMIVEGSTYFDPPDSYRKDPRHTPQGMTHIHVFRNKKQMGVVNLDGSGRDGTSGIKLYNRQGDFVRSKGFNLPKNNIIASDMNESFEPRYVVVISETDLLELLWETEK